MKTNNTTFYLVWIALATFTFCIANTGCGNSGGISREESARELDAAFQKQKNKSEGTERLQTELSKIPSQEMLTKTPYKNQTGVIYILERENNGEYKFYFPPVEDSSTGEMPAANTLMAALVDYKKEPGEPFKIIEQDRIVPSFILNAEVTLIDHTIPAVIYRKTFKGEKPKARFGNSNTVYIKEGEDEVLGEKPLEEVRKFLNNLPYKK